MTESPLYSMRPGQRMICDLSDLATFIKPHSVGIEVGCFAGEGTEILLQSGRLDMLICIDPWQVGYYSNINLADAEGRFEERVAAFPGKTIKLKMNSREGLAKAFSEYGQIDFIYLDGNHDYEVVREDIAQSIEGLGRRGLLAGHDYGLERAPGVKRAVDELLGYPDIFFAGRSWLKFIDRWSRNALERKSG